MALFGKKTTASADDTKTANKADEKKEAVSMKDLYSTPEVKSPKSAAGKTAKKSAPSTAYQVLVKPLVTEKATNLAASNKYVFVVSNGANKISVAKAVESLYGVKPVKVNISNVSGKRVSRGRIRGQRNDWRKAIVTLPAGQTIEIYEGV
jgi:large subunit ribosomal protein L23